MTSRREFLNISLVVSAVPLVAHAARATALTRDARDDGLHDVVPLYKVLYDVRFPASVAFARRAAEQGAATQAMAGDVTSLWYNDLYHRWAQGPAGIAGLTARGALFCLERLAWDQRLRVVFRSEHTLTATGSMAHELSGPAALLPAACRAAAAVTWPAGMADIVLQCPAGRVVAATARATGANSGGHEPGPESLFSWVIAPWR